MPKLQADLKHALGNNQPSLTALDLSNMGLENADIDELVTLLTHNTHVSSINLYRNNLTAPAAKQLARLTRVETIDIGSNDIGDTGVKVLVGNQRIKTLDLSGVGLTDAGAKFIATHATQIYINILDNPQVTDAEAKRVRQRVAENGKAQAGKMESKVKDPPISQLSRSLTQALGTGPKKETAGSGASSKIASTASDPARQFSPFD